MFFSKKIENSIAIWTTKPAVYSDLHINYWIIKRKLILRDHFLDFGIKLLDWSGGLVRLYIPLKVTDKEISPIGTELRNRELANALFNENCVITESSGKRFDIKIPDEELTVFLFDLENDVQIEHRYNGTILSIQIPNENKNWYLRFRLRIPFGWAIINFLKYIQWRTVRSNFSQKHTPKGSFYQSVRSSVESVDFRVNDKRSLSYSLLDHNGTSFLRLRKLHFFLIHDNDEELFFSTTLPKKVRLLENIVWKNYLNRLSGTNRKFCANHWSCKPKDDDGWSIFLKIRYSSSNLISIIFYIFLIIITASLINITSNVFYDNLLKNEIGKIDLFQKFNNQKPPD